MVVVVVMVLALQWAVRLSHRVGCGPFSLSPLVGCLSPSLVERSALLGNVLSTVAARISVCLLCV